MNAPAPNAIFHDPAIYAAEETVVFARSWRFLAAEDQLRAAPALETPSGLRVRRVGGEGVTATDASGRELTTERLGGLWLGAIEPEGSLREELGPLAETVEQIGEAARALLFEVRMEIAGNWKLVVSGAIEDYHLPFVHGTSVNPWRTEPAKPLLVPGGHSSYSCPAELGAVERGLHRMLLGGAPAERTFENLLVYPNLLLIRLWGVIHVSEFVPLGPSKTLRVTRIYGHTRPGRVVDPRRWTRSAMAAAFKQGVQVTFREDRRIVEEAQRGTLAARHMRRGPAHEEEARVEHFLEETEQRLRGAGALPS